MPFPFSFQERGTGREYVPQVGRGIGLRVTVGNAFVGNDDTEHPIRRAEENSLKKTANPPFSRIYKLSFDELTS